MASKVVVIGSVNGQFNLVFTKLAKLQAKSPFSFAIIVGDLFTDGGWEDDSIDVLLSGKTIVPLPTYFTIGKHALPQKVIDKLAKNNDELCSNLFFLGKRSTFKTSEGVRIVALGGELNPEIVASTSNAKYLPFHTEQDAKALHGAHTADILVTSNWPAGIQTGSKITVPHEVEPASEHCVANLCSTLKPRYHFSVTPNAFYEREAFFFSPSENKPDFRAITRFISLASPGSASKAKWLYAFNLDPTGSNPSSIPADATPSPFASTPSALGKRAPASQPDVYSRFSDSAYRGGGRYQDRHRGKRQRRAPNPPAQSECFFCLSNSNLSTQLIVAIGDDSYLTLSKGPVPTASFFAPALDFPGHILIIPLAHAPTIAAIPDSAGDSQERRRAYAEMVRYRHALNEMVRTKGGGKLGSVCWEINKQAGVHVHWQWMPVPVEIVAGGLAEAGFKVEAENLQYSAFEKREVADGEGVGGDWFRLWIWRPKTTDSANMPNENSTNAITNGSEVKSDGADEEEEISLFMPIEPDQRFDLQFGRRVMAKLLGMAQRAHWKDCPQTVEEEKADAEAFKRAFKEWDFSA